VKIALAPEAVEDLAAVVEYLVERNPQAATATADAVFSVIDKLASGEFDGPERELRSTGERVRSWPVRPYRIFYRRMHDGIMCVNGNLWVGQVGEGKGLRFRVTTISLPPINAANAYPTTPKIEFICDAEKHRVVIDSNASNRSRYRAWNKPHSTTEAPDIEIAGPGANVEGTSPCTHSIWTFKKGRAEFEVSDMGCTESTPPKGAVGQLSVSVGGTVKQKWWCY